MTPAEILEALQPLVSEGKIECRMALDLAAKLQIRPNQIGKICNQNEIRIINCQLGCFGSGPKKRDG